MDKATPTRGFNSTSRVLETYAAEDLLWLYDKKLGMDVSHLFEGVQNIELAQCQKSGIKFFQPLVSGDSAFYQKLQETEHYYMTERPDFDTAAGYAIGKNVLEIGSGPGHFSSMIESSDYTGLELNPGAVKAARQKGINVRQQILEEYAEPAGSQHDLVCSFQVLEHVTDIESFFRHALSVTAPGGRLIVSVPAEDSFLGKARNHVLNLPPHHTSLWPDRSFDFLADWFNVELETVKHEKMENIHKQWFFKVASRHRLDSILGSEPGKIDRSKAGRILDLLSSAMSYLLAYWFRDDTFYPTGHTVTAIFRKPVEQP